MASGLHIERERAGELLRAASYLGSSCELCGERSLHGELLLWLVVALGSDVLLQVVLTVGCGAVSDHYAVAAFFLCDVCSWRVQQSTPHAAALRALGR